MAILLTWALFPPERSNVQGTGRRRTVGDHRAAVACAQGAAQEVSGSSADFGSAGTDRNPVRVAIRYPLGHVARGNGLWLRGDVLAPIGRVATSRGVGSIAPSAAIEASPSRQDRLLTGDRRQLLDPRTGGWKKTGPNPTDRRRPGSKHHLLTDAQGIPLSVILTEANRNDITQLLALVQAIPPIAGKRGAPKRKPELLQADRGYDSDAHRWTLHAMGIDTQIARRRTEHGSGLGATRWVVERTIAWLHWFRRLRIRYERLPQIHEAFLKLGCCLICFRFLKRGVSF